MSGGMFIRRFLFDPGDDVLLNIESVNILDLEPPSQVQGIGTGTVLIVCEREDGPFATPTEVTSGTDDSQTFGTLGYTYGGVGGNYPCAISRKADGALAAEFWNGNGFVQLSGKQFARLLVCRVDTSVGQVQISRLAYVEGASSFRYALTSGQVLSLDVGAGYTNATFTATAATRTSVPSQALSGTVSVQNGMAAITFSTSQTLPAGTAIQFASQAGVTYVLLSAVSGTSGTLTTNYTGTTNAATTSLVQTYAVNSGDTLTLGYDDAPNFVVTFLGTDSTQAGVIARINQYAGFSFASTSGGLLALTSLQLGTGAQVRVVASSSMGVLTALGLTVATNLGSGNVANISAVTPLEVAAVVQAAISNTKVEQNSSAALRISNTGTSGFISVGPATTATNLGFVAGQFATSMGQAVLLSGAGTYSTGFGGTETLTLAVDNLAAPVVVAFQSGDQSLAQVVSRINTSFGRTVAFVDGSATFTIRGTNPGGSVQVVGASAGGVLTTLGLVVGTTTGVLPPTGSLPAGTVVQAPSAPSTQIFVTMQSIQFTAAGLVIIGGVVQAAGSTSWFVKIRHAVDDTTGTLVSAAAITQVTNAPDIGAFSVINLTPTTAALTDSQIDAQYVAALASTTDINTVAKQTNILYSARQSNTVRAALRTNAISASGNGCFGRVACIRPPLGTTKAAAQSTTAQPGVGATRDQRVIYCYPGVNTFVPLIGRRGLAGGTGFTASGNIDVGSDGWMASILSQLPPEENPGQETAFTSTVNSLETSPNAQGFGIADYIAFKAAGIAAPRIDDGTMVFQSGVTSVDPVVNPGLVRISRRRMADFIQDSLAGKATGTGKKLMTFRRRKAFVSEQRQFLVGLLSPDNPGSQRIAGFTCKEISTPNQLASGEFRELINVRTLASFDSIVLQSTVGENVTVDEVLPQAA